MNPFPHLFRIDGRSLPNLPPEIEEDVVATCAEIEDRTGFSCWYHAPAKCVHYYRGEHPRIGTTLDYLFEGGEYNPIDAEETCQRIFIAHESLARKEMRLTQSESDQQAERQKAIEDLAGNAGPSLIDEILYHHRKSLDPHSRPSVVVSHKPRSMA